MSERMPDEVKLFAVNECPDGSGRWRTAAACWDERFISAVVSRSRAAFDGCKGHVIEFGIQTPTKPALKPCPNPRWNALPRRDP